MIAILITTTVYTDMFGVNIESEKFTMPKITSRDMVKNLKSHLTSREMVKK